MRKNIIEYFNDTANFFPKKIALVDENSKVTFEELRNRSNILSNQIINKNNSFNKPIAVYLPKGIDSVVSDIAITISSNIFMNLDVDSPIKRVNNILESVKPKVIITNSLFLGKLDSLCKSYQIINIDEIKFDFLINNFIINKNSIDSDPFCIINTSGSTGTPKGVTLTHKNYINYTNWAISTFNLDENYKLGVLSPIFFDHFVYEICLMMFKGVTLVLLNNKMASFPINLLKTLEKNNINYIFWVPTIMVNIANLDLLSKVNLSKLKMVWFAGEVFPTKQFNYWRSKLPNSKFVNLYGPTETSVDCTYYEVERNLIDNEPIPIGKPCENTDIIVLNLQNKEILKDEEGELCVRGTALSMGYYNDPVKTNEVFIQNPLNNLYNELIYRTGDIVSYNKYGELVYRGRKDTLIKHLGYRIELSEIEHILINNFNFFNNVFVDYNSNKKTIILHYESDKDFSVSDFRKKASQIMPKYMIPNELNKMDLFPRNQNGKIDRVKLKNLFK